jgi:phage terminase large subunit GpA-like protein
VNCADGYVEMGKAIALAMTPDPELHLDRFSEEHIVLPKGSAFAGPYRLAMTPYARRVLQLLSPGHPAARVVVMAASQMLKTQVFINAALGWVYGAPANILALEPTDKLAKRLSARAAKAIEVCDVVRERVAKPRSRDARNTVDTKEFDGGALYITTAGSASNLAEIPARYVFCDEVDRIDVIPAEGHPVEIAEARLTTYEGISKAYHVSSPLMLGASKIHELYKQGTMETYHVPCPHCGHLHELHQDNFHYDYDADTDRVTRAWFVCPECGGLIEEHHKAILLPDQDMGGQARWVASSEGDGETVSVQISAFYAPMGSISWLRLARQHARAVIRKERGDPSAMQTYCNTRLGLPFDGSEATTTAQQLAARAEPYPARSLPDRALVLTAWFDTQPNRLEGTLIAWGPQLEWWVLDHIILWGSPTASPEDPGSVWAQLDEIRRTPLAHASGALIRISAYGIDSGGANTQDVYNYGSQRERLGCLVTKGHSLRNKPIIATKPTPQEIDWQGQRTPDGVKLWMMGVDTAKDHIFNRLRLTEGAGAMHTHQQLDPDWYEGLLVEKPQTRWHKGHAIREYIKPNGARNEPLDCAVGNLAIAHYLGLHKWSGEDWRRLRKNLIPADLTPDLFTTVPAVPAPMVEPMPAQGSTPSIPSIPSTPEQQIPKTAELPLSSPPPLLGQPQQPARRILNRGIQR